MIINKACSVRFVPRDAASCSCILLLAHHVFTFIPVAFYLTLQIDVSGFAL